MKTSAAAFLVVASVIAPGPAFAAGSEQDISAVTGDIPCHVRAWVRAPNLEPGTVIEGDVKVKLNGSCDEVSSYSLGLRFAERAWVKTPRKGATLPVKPADDYSNVYFRSSWNQNIYDDVAVNRWHYPGQENGTAWDQYESDMKNPELWLVREEERIAFETRYDLYNGSKGTMERVYEIVKPFALLVPSTNYPPGLDYTMRGGSTGTINAADGEHIYKYFVDVTFSNGTHKEIGAGYTSFDVLTTVGHSRGPESVKVTARRVGVDLRKSEDDASRDKFTLEVIFPNGKQFEYGSTNNITIISHQLGPGSQRALAIESVFSNTQETRRWAATLAADDEAAESLLSTGLMSSRELQAKPNDNYDGDYSFSRSMSRVYPRFSQDGVVENGTMFSTEPITAQFDLPARSFPPFEMYYQTLDHELKVAVRIRNVSEAGLRPNDALRDEEYDWTPELRPEFSYTDTEKVLATIPISAYRKREQHTALSNIVHYLAPKARAPIFVDPSSLRQLLQMTAEDRDILAPLCQAKITARANDDVVKDRYHPMAAWGSHTDYYVGNTWLRKVLTKDNRDTAQQDNVLVVQA